MFNYKSVFPSLSSCAFKSKSIIRNRVDFLLIVKDSISGPLLFVLLFEYLSILLYLSSMNKPKSYHSLLANNCQVCNKGHGLEIHHLKTQKAHPELSDCKQNCITVCRPCHSKFHAKGTNYMAETFPHVKEWLLRHNWEFSEFLGRWMINPE